MQFLRLHLPPPNSSNPVTQRLQALCPGEGTRLAGHDGYEEHHESGGGMPGTRNHCEDHVEDTFSNKHTWVQRVDHTGNLCLTAVHKWTHPKAAHVTYQALLLL